MKIGDHFLQFFVVVVNHWHFFVDALVASDLRKILSDKGLTEAIGRASIQATSELEGFHSSLNRNAPKMEGFSYSGMLSRQVLYWITIIIINSVIFYIS